MATLTLEGSADQAEDGPLEEGEQLVAAGEEDDILIGEPPGSRAHQPGSCCEQCAAIVQAYSKHRKATLVVAIILGQFLSLLLCGTGVTSQLLETNFNIAVPTTQAFLNYALLAAVFGVTLATRGDFLTVFWRNWWKYAILGAIDVEANFLVILAYKYTNLISVQLLDSFTIATVMVLSFFFLRVRYKIINLMGVCLALIGIVSLVLADLQGSRLEHGPNPLLGDLFCLIGSILYAVSNVAQEFLVKNHTVTEYLGLLGVFGSVVSAVQLLLLERAALARIEWNYKIGLLFAGFGVSQFLFYTVMPQVMRFSSALIVNLSLLTADFYTLFFGIFVFHYKFSILYCLSFVLIILGLFIYNLKQPSEAKRKEDGKGTRKRIKNKEKDSQGSHTSHRNLEERLQGLLESRSAELTLAGYHGDTPPLKRPRSDSNKSYGSVEMDNGNRSPKSKRRKGLLREQ